MDTGLECIAGEAYLGRVIVIGMDPSGRNAVMAYAITGRSPYSQARVIEEVKDVATFTLRTKPADEKKIDRGSRSLLIYRCIQQVRGSFMISSGAQTDILTSTATFLPLLTNLTPLKTLVDAFKKPSIVCGVDVATYEPDAPHYTPRISGIVSPGGAAMHIVKRASDDSPQPQYFGVPLIRGQGKLISTYAGQNVVGSRPLPSFQGEPLDVRIIGLTPKEVAEHLHQALGPASDSGPDFRVSVAAVFYNREKDVLAKPHIINMYAD